MHQSVDLATTRGVHSILRDQSVFLNPALFKGESTVYVREKQKETIIEKRRKFYTFTVRYKNVLFVRRTTKKVEIREEII